MFNDKPKGKGKMSMLNHNCFEQNFDAYCFGTNLTNILKDSYDNVDKSLV